ncbi:Vacuolar import and degradation protein 30 [Nakaseomyces glabratus]|uniref:Vacuolar import and degradation protein 30 n=1 Tax=Candida glabrata TaxID=5478 RepID=A0A0W0D1R5_CANGB|nr:Vacuolar import and degradation protein 30 [Nakaseomyces glabratus]KTB05224.1 Vacuolar import and degradation protein 30 [Nakaseomyces glabratus]KTB05767.1 Vacuolar import and degradation protein 30 [Nakaseomyces glabratus]KTB13049.1 Vacuolar import and degradation protein 30 [Nakaseomyces glabratus]
MTGHLDEVDREFIKSLFPEYLLEQPVAYDLLWIYRENKKIFCKTPYFHHSKDEDRNGLLTSSILPPKLSYRTKKEIWQKLMNLGVLGTLSFDAANDEYLVQAYKYFYSDNNNEKSHMKVPGSATKSKFSKDIKKTMNEADDSLQRVHDVLDQYYLNSVSGENINVDSNNASRLYPALNTQKYMSKKKNNSTTPNVYNLMGYFLPTQWMHKENNSILVSSDGITELRANPNWQPFISNDRGDIFARNRLRNALTSSQKTEFVTTYADEIVSNKKVAIFYYEVRVLDVTSSKSAQNSNIVVGYKIANDSDDEIDLEKIDEKALLELVKNFGAGDNNELGGLADIGGTLMGRADSTATDPAPGLAKKNTLDETFVGYCGLSGNISITSKEKPYSKPYGRDDVIGCGINYVNGSVFFTKNGVFLGEAVSSLMNVNAIPYIALKSGNSVRTNFGLYEEFVFDINQYQKNWKRVAYKNIFKASITSHQFPDTKNTLIDESQMEIDDDADESQLSLLQKGLILGKDNRISENMVLKPDDLLLNTLNTQDGSMISNLNVMINDYLIHEGLIDVAKGFLKDLQKFSLTNPYDNQIQIEEREIIKHNESQIIREENVLRIRQELRKLINQREIEKCITFLNDKIPDLLGNNVELHFELRVVQYLIQLSNSPKIDSNILIEAGQNLSREFVFNNTIPQELRDKFQDQLSNVSSLLVYEDPLTEAPDELSYYFSPEYLQDRLFQLTNSTILKHMKKSSECALDNIVSYSRAMSLTLLNLNAKGKATVYEDDDAKLVDTARYYKLINIDGDLLSL